MEEINRFSFTIEFDVNNNHYPMNLHDLLDWLENNVIGRTFDDYYHKNIKIKEVKIL